MEAEYCWARACQRRGRRPSAAFPSTSIGVERMPKTYRMFAALSFALGISTFTASGNSLAAQEQTRSTAAESPAPALDDATIVAIFDNANTVDIETGKLAAKRGHSKDVRQFGAMLA